MGKTIFIFISLVTIIVGSIIAGINTGILDLSESLSNSYDQDKSKFISNTFAHNTVKDIRRYYINEDVSIKLWTYPSTYIKRDTVIVTIYNDYFPGVRQLIKGAEWGISSVGIYNKHKYITNVIYSRLPYSDFGLFVNTFPTNSYFGDGEILSGNIYVKGNLNVGSSYYNMGPTFLNKVFYTNKIVYTKLNPSLYKGFISGPPIKLEEPLNLVSPMNSFNLNSSDLYNSYKLPNQYNCIALRGNYVNITKNNNQSSAIKIYIKDIQNKVIYNNNINDIYIKGNISTKLSIMSNGDIYADSSIINTNVSKSFIEKTLINKEKLTIPNKSILGILTNKNFIINSSAASSNYNVLIMAAIYTNQKIIIIENNMNSWRWTNNNPRYFIVYGSRTQNEMQNQTFSSGMGLKELIVFNSELLKENPPMFPYTDKGAKISLWSEKVLKD